MNKPPFFSSYDMFPAGLVCAAVSHSTQDTLVCTFPRVRCFQLLKRHLSLATPCCFSALVNNNLHVARFDSMTYIQEMVPLMDIQHHSALSMVGSHQLARETTHCTRHCAARVQLPVRSAVLVSAARSSFVTFSVLFT